jgi:group I intron endonuclease
MLIYAAQNTTNLKQYVGRTCRTLEWRKQQHLGAAFSTKLNFYFYNALRKYGQEKFEWRIIDTCEGMADDDFAAANEKEAYYIEKLGTFADADPGGYNLVISGPNGACSEETKAKMSASHIGVLNHMYGKKLSEEAKAKIGRPGVLHHMYGKKLSEETKAKISANLSGVLNHMYGKKHSEEAKAKMSASSTGKQLKVTCPYCEKVGGINAMKRWHFDNCKLKGN